MSGLVVSPGPPIPPDPKRDWVGKAIAATFLVAVAFVAGSISGHRDAPPAPKAVVVTHTKNVPGPTTTVERQVVPQVCKDALAKTHDVQTATAHYEKTLGQLSLLLDDLYRVIATQDLDKLRGLKQRQINLKNDSLQDLLDMESAQSDLKKLEPKCQQAIN